MNKRAGLTAPLKRRLPRPLARAVRSLYYAMYRTWIRWRIWRADARSAGVRHPRFQRLPPARLRFRVSESPDLGQFLEVGEKSAQALRACLDTAGRNLEAFQDVLDFGCGCGRTLLWLARDSPGVRFFGADTDEEAIGWCSEHLMPASFTVNGVLPPLPYPDETFDFIYSISVFTHLDEAAQREWMSELRRVLKPGGMLLFTIHGPAAQGALQPEQVQELARRGFLFLRSEKLCGFCPSWYQTAYHTPGFARELAGRYFSILAYLPRGMGYQDVVVAER